MSESEPIRLSRLMSQHGLCSRREADRFIERGLVSVDGKIVSTLGTKVLSTQTVELHRKAQSQQATLKTILLNKPPGYVSGLPEKGYPSAVMLINSENSADSGIKTPSRKGLAPAGRLDIDSTGLIVFTGDGRIARQLIGEYSEIEKEYRVGVSGNVTDKKLAALRHGLNLDDRKLKPATIELADHDELRFVLKEGRKRQIRRMCELVDLRVTRLKRTRIGKIKLAGLARGKWRLLKPGEQF